MVFRSHVSARRSCFFGLMIAAIASGVWMGAAAQQSGFTADGAYSDAQAARGEALYATFCRSCHGAQLTGTEFAPGITGAEFRVRWQARSPRELFDVVYTTMPLNSPGGLSASQNADIVAFMLRKAGFVAGASDFIPPVAEMPRAAAPPPTPAATGVPPGGWYTDAQAVRGKALFYRHCAMCHTSGDPSMEKTDAQPDRGWHMGGRPSMRGLPIRHYPTVYNLYQRIRDSMPGWDIDSASPSEKVDIVAYLLEANKFPAGSSELSLDVAAMRTMPIKTVPPFVVEQGFEPLVSGSRAPGLKYIFGFNCVPAPSGCGRTDAAGVVRVQDDVLIADGRYHGMIYTEKRYRDFDWRFEYRFIPPPDFAAEEEFFAVSSGYMLFVDAPSVWPKSIEVEGNEYGLLAAHALGGGKLTSKYDDKAVERYRKAIGKWNAVQIVSSAGEIKIYLNGGLITHVTQHTYAPGHLGFQYQGGHIEWRRIRIKGE